MAELSAFWIANAPPFRLFAFFCAWLDSKFPGSLGQFNHCGGIWLPQFCVSLCHVLERSTMASIHMLVPALGLPSDITRAVDGISVQTEENLWGVLYVLTSPDGSLAWHLLDLPNFANPAPLKQRDAGVKPLPRFALHGAERLVALTHHVESRFQIETSDRLLRLALNVGDGAIEGPLSIHFAEYEASVNGNTYEPRSSASCEFHAEDHAGADTDNCFQLARVF